MAGQWWLPELPNEQKTGTLKYSDEDGFTLTIPFGNLCDLPRSFGVGDRPKRLPLLLGILINGKNVTLVDVLITNMNLHFPGGRSEEYKCLLGFIGSIESESNPHVEKLQVKFSHLRDWIGWQPEAILKGDEQTLIS